MKATLVKVFLVLNFLLCFAVAGFGVKVFMDREVVNARSVILRDSLREVAENLDFGEVQPWEDEAAFPAGFSLNLPDSEAGLVNMVAELEKLESLAGARVDQLSEQYETLITTQQELSTTREILAERVADLQATRTRVAALEQTLATTQNQVRDTRNDLADLEQANQSLQRQIEDLDQQIGNIQEDVSETRQQLELRTTERDRIETLLAACRQPTNVDGSVESWKNQTGQILAIEPEWNYVVINKGEVDVLPMFIEAFVHRGDEFVGKIRVMQVDDTVALAEVIEDSLTPGMTVQAGDTIFF